MRISDWSSDVCSSDLVLARGVLHQRHGLDRQVELAQRGMQAAGDGDIALARLRAATQQHRVAGAQAQRGGIGGHVGTRLRSEEHTSELQSLMRISYAVFCLKKDTPIIKHRNIY